MPDPKHFQPIAEDARNTHEAIRDFLHGLGVPGFMALFTAGRAAAMKLSLPGMMGEIVALLRKLLLAFLTQIIDFIEGARKTGDPDFDRLITTVINAYLNTNFDPARLSLLRAAKGDAKAMQAIGQDIFAMLEHNFTEGGKLSAEQGQRAAHALTGYSVDIAVENAFQALVVEGLSIGQIDSMAQVGDTLANLIGLPRLQRRALGNLVETTVGIPYDWYLNEKYSPTRLNKAEVIRAFKRKEIEREDVNHALAQMGYRNADIDLLLTDDPRTNTVGDLARLQRFEVITEQQAVDELMLDGLTETRARHRLLAQHLARAEGRVNELVNLVESRLVDGIIDHEQAVKEIEGLPMAEVDRKRERAIIGFLGEFPRKDLSLAQTRQAFLDGIIGLSDVESYLERVGYTPSAKFTLVLQFLLDLLEKTNKEKAREKVAEGIRSKANQIIDDQTRNAILGGN
jgi:hypothetical protein